MSKPKSALQRWMYEFQLEHPPREVLRQIVADELQQFEAMAAERKADLARAAAEPDDDGFVLVTRTHRRARVLDPASGATQRAAKAGVTAQLQPKAHERDDFYRFQVRRTSGRSGGPQADQQRTELLRRFEQDKRKLVAAAASARASSGSKRKSDF